MLTRRQFLVLTGLAVLALVLTVTDILMFNVNRQAQNEFNVRAQYIQQTLQIEPIYQGVIRTLAELSAKSDDAQIRNLLASQGITYSVNASQGKNK